MLSIIKLNVIMFSIVILNGSMRSVVMILNVTKLLSDIMMLNAILLLSFILLLIVIMLLSVIHADCRKAYNTERHYRSVLFCRIALLGVFLC